MANLRIVWKSKHVQFTGAAQRTRVLFQYQVINLKWDYVLTQLLFKRKNKMAISKNWDTHNNTIINISLLCSEHMYSVRNHYKITLTLGSQYVAYVYVCMYVQPRACHWNCVFYTISVAWSDCAGHLAAGGVASVRRSWVQSPPGPG